MTLYHMMRCYVGVTTGVQLLRGTTPLKFRRAKTFKIWCDLGQLSNLIASISGTTELSTSDKQRYQLRSLHR